MLKSYGLLIVFFKLFLLRRRLFALVSPCLLLVILNADPAVIPCLAEGISAGRYVHVALAYSLGAGVAPDVTCRFSRRMVLVHVGISLLAVLVLLLLLKPVMLLIGGSLFIFRLVARFRIDAWMADVACPIACQPIWPACWMDTPDRSSSSPTRIVQDVWDVCSEMDAWGGCPE